MFESRMLNETCLYSSTHTNGYPTPSESAACTYTTRCRGGLKDQYLSLMVSCTCIRTSYEAWPPIP